MNSNIKMEKLNSNALELFKGGYTNILLKWESYPNDFSDLKLNVVLNDVSNIKS